MSMLNLQEIITKLGDLKVDFNNHLSRFSSFKTTSAGRKVPMLDTPLPIIDSQGAVALLEASRSNGSILAKGMSPEAKIMASFVDAVIQYGSKGNDVLEIGVKDCKVPKSSKHESLKVFRTNDGYEFGKLITAVEEEQNKNQFYYLHANNLAGGGEKVALNIAPDGSVVIFNVNKAKSSTLSVSANSMETIADGEIKIQQKLGETARHINFVTKIFSSLS